jgi:peroxiredoxin
VLIDFWAAWCSPCKASMPEIQKLHEKFKDKGLEVLGISAWPRGTDPVKYMTEQKFTYGLLMDGDSVAEAYKVDGLPTWFVIGRDGKIAGTGSGYKAGDETRMAEASEVGAVQHASTANLPGVPGTARRGCARRGP